VLGKLGPNGDTHLQGAVAKDGHYLLTHSMKGRKSGRLLVVDRASRTLVHQYDLPPVEPGFFHAGGFSGSATAWSHAASAVHWSAERGGTGL
jgi:hypothetical protein